MLKKIMMKKRLFFSVLMFAAYICLFAQQNSYPKFSSRSISKKDMPEMKDKMIQRLSKSYEMSIEKRAKVYCNVQDSLALVALYNATGGASWTNKTGWLTSPVSSWFGVSLDETGRVKNINLYYNHLTGSIPVEIGNFTNLQRLELNSNQLTGSIPASIGNLTSLQYLRLTWNQLTGSIPAAIGNLTKLQDLRLYVNQLTGSIPAEIGNLTNLQDLFLYDNQLTGSIPVEIGNLTNLQELFLSYNQLTGSIPVEIGNLIKLQTLYLHENQFNTIPNLSSLTLLSSCYIYNNYFDFGDLETANINWTNFNSYSYSPQSKIGTAETISLNSGDNYLLSVVTPGTDNTYQWYKNTVLIGDATQNTLQITGFVPATDAGVYYCTIKNAAFPDLTLSSKSITLTYASSVNTLND